MSNEEVLKVIKKALMPVFHEDVEFITKHDIFMEEACAEEYSLCGTRVKGSQVWYVNTSKCIHNFAVAVYKLANQLCVSFKILADKVANNFSGEDVFFAIEA